MRGDTHSLISPSAEGNAFPSRAAAMRENNAAIARTSTWYLVSQSIVSRIVMRQLFPGEGLLPAESSGNTINCPVPFSFFLQPADSTSGAARNYSAACLPSRCGIYLLSACVIARLMHCATPRLRCRRWAEAGKLLEAREMSSTTTTATAIKLRWYRRTTPRRMNDKENADANGRSHGGGAAVPDDGVR